MLFQAQQIFMKSKKYETSSCHFTPTTHYAENRIKKKLTASEN